MFATLRDHGIDESYISLLQLLYAGQTGSVNGSKSFSIERGIKQGDCLSAIIFNCVMDIAFAKWKLKLRHHGLFIGTGLERLTNTRYADDILLYAKSLSELTEMMELLIDELKQVGLQLNTKKTKILHTDIADDDHDVDFIDISGEFVSILHGGEFHRYLGRFLCLSQENRLDIEFKHRKQQGWFSFQKHRKCLLNKHISLKRRLHYFDVCITPCVLVALTSFPMLRSQLEALDILQRKILRRIVGWRSLPDESWEATMSRMKRRLEHGQMLYYCEPWSIRFARAQWRYINHILHGPLLLWARTLCKYNWNPHRDHAADALPHRGQGRPRMRWDDNIHRFCHSKWPHLQDYHWFDLLIDVEMKDLEDEFIIFICAT